MNYSIFYWISLFIGGSSITFSYIADILSKERFFPTLSNIVISGIPGRIFKWMTILNSPFLLVTFYTTFKYFKKNSLLVSESSKKLLTQLTYLFVVTSFTFAALNVAILFITPLVNPPLHYTLLFFFALSGILFSYAADYAYAVSTGNMIKLSMNLNLFGIVVCLAALLTTMLTVRFDIKAKVFELVAAIAQEMGYSLFYCKILFLGVYSLGARFISAQVDILRKERQTLILNSIDMV